jgi:ABC-2 type transport system ATP-binding protein
VADPAVVVRGLRRSYGTVEAVRGIDLDVARGEVFALLGPNGAGKTTTVEILEGHRSRTAGEVSVLGFDPARNDRARRERVGIVLQQTGVDGYLTVREIVDLVRGYYPAPRPTEEVLAITGLSDVPDRRVRMLSGGQRRRVDLAVALAGDPELLFLDEPTTGFDPAARRQAWSTIRGLVALGTTIFLTTHFMDEAHALADRLAIIVGGRIVAAGTADELIGSRGAGVRVRFRSDLAPPAALGATNDGAWWSFVTQRPTEDVHALTGWALRDGGGIRDLEVTRRSLEDVYLELTGSAAEPGSTEDGNAAPVREAGQ